jgi:chitin synthase
MVEAFGKHWENHSSFKVGSVNCLGFPTFTINHFNGPVTYSAKGFLKRNLDSLSPDFVSLLRGNITGYEATAGGKGSGFLNLFVHGLFSGKAIATQMHPRNEETIVAETIVAAKQPIKPMHNPLT